MAEPTTVTMGWDVGDKFTDVCALGPDGAILEQPRVYTTKHSLEKQLTRHPGALVVLEVGVHSRWISDLVRRAGHPVIVANARQVQLIYKRKSKTDRSDALLLARLGRFDPTLLAPIPVVPGVAGVDAPVHDLHAARRLFLAGRARQWRP